MAIQGSGVREKVMSDLEKLLEEIERDYWYQDGDERESLLNMLKRRLLPLLEAGQAMRVRLDYNTALPQDIQAREAWDAAWEKAKGKHDVH